MNVNDLIYNQTAMLLQEDLQRSGFAVTEVMPTFDLAYEQGGNRIALAVDNGWYPIGLALFWEDADSVYLSLVAVAFNGADPAEEMEKTLERLGQLLERSRQRGINLVRGEDPRCHEVVSLCLPKWHQAGYN
jgi:hypothetical protein